MAISTPTPMGPGFFIFFQLNPVDVGSADLDAKALNEILRDDEDVLELIQMVMQSGALDE